MLVRIRAYRELIMENNEEEKEARDKAVENYKKRKEEEVKDNKVIPEDSSVWIWRGSFVLLLPILIICILSTIGTILTSSGGLSLLVLLPTILILAPITILAGKHWNG